MAWGRRGAHAAEGGIVKGNPLGTLGDAVSLMAKYGVDPDHPDSELKLAAMLAALRKIEGERSKPGPKPWRTVEWYALLRVTVDLWRQRDRLSVKQACERFSLEHQGDRPLSPSTLEREYYAAKRMHKGVI